MKTIAILTMVLTLAVMAGVALAAPGGGPWEPVDEDGDGVADRCTHPSGQPGELYLNTRSGNVHCFKA